MNVLILLIIDAPRSTWQLTFLRKIVASLKHAGEMKAALVKRLQEEQGGEL
jgi:hypothetical protein